MDHPMIGFFGHLSEDVSLNENKIKSFSSLYNYIRYRTGEKIILIGHKKLHLP